MSLPEQTSIGRYELRGRLGSGGMGTVWRAHDPTLRRDVAVKEIHLPTGMPREDRENARARMVREARTAARISHPSVVTVHDVLEVEGTPYIVMELLDGESLRDRVRRTGPLPAHEVEQIARPLLAALRAAHRSGVVHRDVKPANIMLSDGGSRPVLTDFGIASLLDGAATSITRTGVIIGTAAYSAPERLDRDETTAASDQWSLGATLFAALAGASPFKRETLTSTLTAVITMPVPPPPAGGRLAAVIGGLLVRDPRRRLTPDQALALLDAPEPRPVVPPPGPAPRRAGPLLWVGAAVLAVLLIGAVAWSLPRVREEAAGAVSGDADASVAPDEEEGEEGDEDVPDGFAVLDDDHMTLAYPEDWEAEDVTDEDGGTGSVTRLSSFDFETAVGTGTATVAATEYVYLPYDAEGVNLRQEELLEDDEYSDVRRLRLEEAPAPDGAESSVYEATYHRELSERPERWLLARQFVDPGTGRAYRLSINFPAEVREEYRADLEDVVDSFAPRT